MCRWTELEVLIRSFLLEVENIQCYGQRWKKVKPMNSENFGGEHGWVTDI
jgi:hypothetical protein